MTSEALENKEDKERRGECTRNPGAGNEQGGQKGRYRIPQGSASRGDPSIRRGVLRCRDQWMAGGQFWWRGRAPQQQGTRRREMRQLGLVVWRGIEMPALVCGLYLKCLKRLDCTRRSLICDPRGCEEGGHGRERGERALRGTGYEWSTPWPCPQGGPTVDVSAPGWQE